METDRGAVLTCRAAARRVVDYSQAQVLDIGWWRSTNAKVSAMARLDEIEGIKAAYDYQRSLVGNGGLTGDSFKEAQKTARDLFGKLVDALSPWASKNAESFKEQEINSLIDTYKKIIGDPNDPEFMAKLVHDLALQDQKRREVTVTESEEDRVDRLLKERDAYYSKRGMR